MKKISLATTSIPFRSKLNVLSCLQSGFIGRGMFVRKLEEKFKEYFQVRNVIAVANGTLADIVMLSALKEICPQKERNEVILPALTFVAQANAVIWAGLKPVFVDVKSDMLIDEDKAIRKVNEKTLCIFPVHLMGKSAFRSHKLHGSTIPVLEDCCESMGGNGRFGGADIKLGTIGGAGAFSMYPSHTITTGEGGLIITNNDEFARICRSIHNHGKRGDDFDFDFVGINAKMTNLQAAIGCELVRTIDDVNDKRNDRVNLYNHILGQHFYATAPHGYPVELKNKAKRDACLEALKKNGIQARKLMGCIPDDAPYVRMFGVSKDSDEFQNARYIANHCLFVPVHQDLTKGDIKRICKVLCEFR